MKPETREKLARRLFMVSLTVAIVGGAFLYGALAYRDDLPPIPQVRGAYEAVTTIGDNDLTNDPRRHHLQPARGQGDGVTVNAAPDDGSLVFLAGFFDEENQLRIIERDGTVVKKWSLDYFDHFPDSDARPCVLPSSLRVDTHGAHVTPRGDVLVNYEYCGTVKLDQCGGLVWRVDQQTHHSLVPAEAGGYWLLGRDRWRTSEHPDRFPPFSNPARAEIMLEDTILRIGEDGEVLDEISIPGLMRDNGLEAVLTASRGNSFGMSEEPGDWEMVHANKVTELPSEIAEAYPTFEAGDLAISLRGRNLVMVVDPDTHEVRWHQIGPWLRQHDPEFRADGRISIFNNNVFGTAYQDEQTVLDTPYTTNITVVDPMSRETEVLFGEEPGQEMLSVLRGDHELLEDGGMLITEFDAGRVLEVDQDGRIVWEFVNHYDSDHVAEVTNASLYPADYFRTEWQTCE